MKSKKGISKLNNLFSKKVYGSQKEDVDKIVRKRRYIILILTFVFMLVVLAAMIVAIIFANEKMDSINSQNNVQFIVDNINGCLLKS